MMTNSYEETISDSTKRDLEKIFLLVDRWVARTRQQSLPVEPRSSLSTDDERTHPFEISHAVAMLMASAVDHMETLKTTTVHAGRVHTWSTLTILRSALENSAIAVWLLSGRARKERILRLLQFQRMNAKDRDGVMQLAPGQQPRSLQEDIAKLMSIGKASGLDPNQLTKINTPPGTTQLIEEADRASPSFGNGLALFGWKCCSGIAHGRPWATLSLLQYTSINTTANDKLNLQITLPDSSLVSMAETAALMIHEGWTLFDRQRVPNYY